MVKKAVIKRIAAFNYPQLVFARAVRSYIQKHYTNPSLIVDCPCGNGETSFHLASIPGCRVLAADSSSESIDTAKANFSKPNLRLLCSDIRTIVQTNEKIGVFCIINSLFLLPDAEGLLKDLHAKLQKDQGKLLLVIPNTEGKNFTWFQRQHPHENRFIISRDQVKPFFENLGFAVDAIEPLAYAHHMNRRDIKLFSVFWSFYLLSVNAAQRLLKIGKPNYFLIALSA